MYLLLNWIVLEVQNTVGVGAVLMLTQSQKVLLLYLRHVCNECSLVLRPSLTAAFAAVEKVVGKAWQ